jgi:hypothetical protein
MLSRISEPSVLCDWGQRWLNGDGIGFLLGTAVDLDATGVAFLWGITVGRTAEPALPLCGDSRSRIFNAASREAAKEHSPRR